MMNLPEGYAMRPAVLDDAADIAGVVNAESVAVVGQPMWDADETRANLQSPGIDTAQDTRLVSAANGQTAGYVVVSDYSPHVQLFTTVAVHPAHEGRGIASALAAWAEGRARMSIGFASPGAQVVLGQEIPASHTAALALLRASGYQPVRYISRLQMSLEPPPPDPVTPDGIVIRPYRGQTELPQVVRAFEEALRDQWGHLEEPLEESLAEWEAWIATSQRFDPGLWLLATDGQEIAGAILSEGATVEDPQMGSVSEFGVRRPWRRRGIGTALLLSLLRELRRRGFERAALSADADSLTGATHLYERIGFRPDWQSIVMEKELRPGRDPRAQSAAP